MGTILKAQNDFRPETRPTRAIFIALTVAIATSLGLVGRAAKPNPTPAVISSIADTQNSVSLRIESDLQNETALGGTYFNNVGGVTSIIQNGEWFLQTYQQYGRNVQWTRTMYLDLTEGAAPPFVTPARAPVFVNTRCGLIGGVGLMAIQTGNTAVCGIFIRFLGSDNQWYRLAMNTENWPTTSNDVSVTCNKSDSSGCNWWTITPITNPLITTGTDPNPKTLAQLLKIDSGGNVLAVLGTYYVSFTFNVTR